MQRDVCKGPEGIGQRADRGVVMVIAMLLMTGLIFIAGTATIRSSRATHLSAVELDNTRAFYAAEGAVESAAANLQDLLVTAVDPSAEQVENISTNLPDGFDLENFSVIDNGAPVQETITTGDYAGLIGFVQRYSITAGARGDRRYAEVQREIEHQFIPLFQFGVFYEADLEIFPGPTMVFEGPIHTNSNLYMGAVTSISCRSTVTAVGNYYHYRKANGVDEAGPVQVADQNSVLQNVWRGTYWLDERRPTWATESLALWGGKFRDAAHNLKTLRLPLPPAADQHVIIERGSVGDTQLEREAKYWYKAGVRYVNHVLTDSAGNPLAQPGVYTYTQNKFWDDREDRTVDCVDIDIAAMIAGNYVPANRIIYVTHASGDRPVVRLKNASTLPTGGLTIATDLPMYVWGHYNSVAKKGSALLCDAITLLSPAWLDANSNLPLANRIPVALTMNACVMSGHVGTAGSNYSGGLENSFRFLERWTNVWVTYRGSIVNLWFSIYNTALWGGSYYSPPNRNWGFDTDLLQPGNWPPGTPRAQTIQRGVWRQIS